MSQKRGFYNKHKVPKVGDKARQVLENIDETNPVIIKFKEYAAQLDEKHDRYERIVKISRDITIESKRIIFLLHNTNIDIESKKESNLQEAHSRLMALVDTHFKNIATELKGRDSYQYHRAFTAGMQEFVEAFIFYLFIKNDNIENYDFLNKCFNYKDENDTDLKLFFDRYDFILGIADFTGEVMRKCINTLGVGNVSECFKLCNYVKFINTGFLGLMCPGNKELGRKGYFLRQSLSKMELVCYNIQIRGQEIPKHMLLSVIESSEVNNEDDEGFF